MDSEAGSQVKVVKGDDKLRMTDTNTTVAVGTLDHDAAKLAGKYFHAFQIFVTGLM
jgi:hypothetical protein